MANFKLKDYLVASKEPRRLYEYMDNHLQIAAIAQGYYFNKCGMRLIESKNGTPFRRNTSFIHYRQLQHLINQMEDSQISGDVLMLCEDFISPSVCAKKQFRKDGKGLCKQLVFTAIDSETISVCSTLQAGIELPDGEVVKDKKSPCKKIEMLMPKKYFVEMLNVMEEDYKKYTIKQQQIAAMPKAFYSQERELDIAYA